ncbi:MAG TPA: hypothetical protein VK727_08450 [Steroidobacteraceae bacterium]|jgi:hypothetical protein|nr:hypothetical protein [Steroidobacteraceae bacterium]
MTETATVFALRREAIIPRRAAPTAREPARKQRRYQLSKRLESFLRSKYLENPVSPVSLPSGAPLVFPLTSDSRTRSGDGGSGFGQTGVRRALRTAARLVALALTLLLFGAIAFEDQAHAGQILTQTGAFVGPSEAAEYSMNITSPGTLTMNLIDYGWPSPLAALTLDILSPTAVVGQMTGAGLETLSLTAPGTYYAFVNAVAATGHLEGGSYGLTADFQALGSTPVPLPASISLLLGGLMVLLWSARRKARTGIDTSRALSPTRHGPRLAC